MIPPKPNISFIYSLKKRGISTNKKRFLEDFLSDILDGPIKILIIFVGPKPGKTWLLFHNA